MLWPCLLALIADPLPVFRDPNAAIELRVNDLVKRMTLDEKVSQMKHQASAVPRLGIPAYNWWNEALHGVMQGPYSTEFPQGIGLGATWDAPLMHKVGDTISTEARAKYNEEVRKNPTAFEMGIDFWAPNINIFRDPRWGRGQETYGEDPYLTSTLGVQFIKGLQGDNPKYLKTIATPKHYAVHSGPEPIRNRFDAQVGVQDMYGTYLPQFEAAIREGGAYSIMGAYNRVNGVPCNANPLLLQKILREEWGFKGYVVSDCGAITNIFADHHFVPTKEDAVAVAVKAGCDLECGGIYPSLVQAVKMGKITEAEIDTSVKRLMEARFRLGMFDPPSMVPYSKIPYSIIDCQSHRDLALQAAHESMVLLKNDLNTLPLASKVHTLAVIGPHADNAPVMMGNYNGTPRTTTTVLQGIQASAAKRGIKVLYAKGSGVTDTSHEPVPAMRLLDPNGREGGLRGEYFANKDLKGEPVLIRTEVPDFDWGNGSPGPKVPVDNFSARWTGSIVPTATGPTTIGFTADDGVRMWIDGKLVFENWTEHAPQRSSVTIPTVANKPLSVKIEYFESAVGAVAKLDWSTADAQPYKSALEVAAKADVVVMVLGISQELESEGLDRADLDLPPVQQKLLEAVKALNKPIVLVTMNGSPLTLNWAERYVPAIVEAWYPGEAGGTAVADVLFGDYNPGGRLPVTFPESLRQVPEFTDYSMKGRTYRYMTAEPLYRFGYGLSYTTFEYSNLRAMRKPGGPWEVFATVTNTGNREGDEVAQFYLAHTAPKFTAPIRELKGFRRLHLIPGESQTVRFPMTEKELSLVDAEGKRVLVHDAVRLFVGGHQPVSSDSARPDRGPVVSVELADPAGSR